MTDTTETPAPGVWQALLAFLSSLKGYLPPLSAVWSALLYAAVAALGAAGYAKIGPANEVKVTDQRAIDAAVAATIEKEASIANARVAAVSEKLNMDELATQCGNAVKDAIAASKKRK